MSAGLSPGRPRRRLVQNSQHVGQDLVNAFSSAAEILTAVVRQNKGKTFIFPGRILSAGATRTRDH